MNEQIAEETKNAPRFKTTKQTGITNVTQSIASGVYYLHAMIGGKLFHVNLKTMVKEEAVELRDREMKRIRDDQAFDAARGKGEVEDLTLRMALEALKVDLTKRVRDYGKADDGVSPNTLDTYSDRIDKLINGFGKDGVAGFSAAVLDKPLRNVTEADLKEVYDPLISAYKAATPNVVKAILKATFEIGLERGACRHNVAVCLRRAKTKRSKFVLLTKEEHELLLKCISHNATLETIAKRELMGKILVEYTPAERTDFERAFVDHPEWLPALGLPADFQNITREQMRPIWDMAKFVRDVKAGTAELPGAESADLVMFYSYCGGRLTETSKLTLDSVDWNKWIVNFDAATTKGANQDKCLPVHPDLRPALLRCKERAAKRGDRELFGVGDPRRAIRTACKRLKFAHLTPHKFRHLFASNLYEAGANDAQVAWALGHRDNGKTARETYIHVSAKAAAARINQISYITGAPAPAIEDEVAALKAEVAALKAQNSALLEAIRALNPTAPVEMPTNVLQLRQA